MRGWYEVAGAWYGSSGSDVVFHVIKSGGATSGGMVEPAIFRCNVGVSFLHQYIIKANICESKIFIQKIYLSERTSYILYNSKR